MEIRQRYFNVIIIMRAVPIVDVKPSSANTSESQVIPVGFPTRLASCFKANVMQSLSSYSKVLCMKFGILTRNELIDSLRNGCRVLQINSDYVEQDCLCVEGENGTIDRISFEDLQYIFSPKTLCFSPRLSLGGDSTPILKGNPSLTFSSEVSGAAQKAREVSSANLEKSGKDHFIVEKVQGDSPNSMGIQLPMCPIPLTTTCVLENKVLDVLILGIKNNRRLAEIFIDLQIPHIITFEFTSYEVDFRHKDCEDECIDHFCINFYEELIAQKSIFEAFDSASNQVFDYLGEKYFNGKPRSYVTSVIGPGPILLPQGADHSEALFSAGRFPLATGWIEDISSTVCPTNIEKVVLPFTGRRFEMYTIIQKIRNRQGFLEITGPSGIGKTTTVLQMGYYILNRNLFPDGIFYIPIKALKYKLNQDYHMEDLLWETLGLDFQSGFVNFFKGKKMLLIFDDFDLFYNRDLEFPRLFFLTLKECKITCIMVTTSNGLENESGDDLIMNKHRSRGDSRQRMSEIEEEILDNNCLELKGLSETELALIVQSLTKGIEKNEFITVEELKKSPVVKEANGNPKYIIEKLLEGKIRVHNEVLNLCPHYQQDLHYEEIYLYDTDRDLPSLPPFMISRNASSQPREHDPRQIGKPSSLSEIEQNQLNMHLRKNSARMSGINMMENPLDLYKSKSHLYENIDPAELTLTKGLSAGLRHPQMKRNDKIKRYARPSRQRRRPYGGGVIDMINTVNPRTISSESLSINRGRIPQQILSEENLKDEYLDVIAMNKFERLEPTRGNLGMPVLHSDSEILEFPKEIEEKDSLFRLDENKRQRLERSRSEESLEDELLEQSEEEELKGLGSIEKGDIEWDLRSHESEGKKSDAMKMQGNNNKKRSGRTKGNKIPKRVRVGSKKNM